ncbi:MAG: hypothetical protein OEM60_09810, partial [Gammaproteobacteria bacterium]|nr:hypothetical protein [Gammaproteobacteria bacterium]
MRKTTWMSVSFAVALLTGLPAVADDTELLLINPDPSQNPKPNVMFILDSSGSMTTTQSTLKPYNSATVYAGDCDSTALYWTDVDVTPDCSVPNDQWFYKSNYYCDFSTRQIEGIGSYTDTMIMFRPDVADPAKNSWNDFVAGRHDDPIECQA